MIPIERNALSEYMHSEVSAYLASNQSVRHFCEGKPYTFHKLNYWVLKIRKEEISKQSIPGSGFSTIKASNNRAPITHADIIYPNGIRIAVYEPLSSSLLKSLL